MRKANSYWMERLFSYLLFPKLLPLFSRIGKLKCSKNHVTDYSGMKNMGEGSLYQFAEKLILAVIARSVSDAAISKCLILL